MSVEITIYPPKASRKELRDLLEVMEFKKCESVVTWPKGTSHYMCFIKEDFKSNNGVEATIYRPDKEEIEKYRGGSWAVHTRLRAGGSEFDQNRQNQVIKEIKRRFGGNFYNDWNGKNRYRVIEKD